MERLFRDACHNRFRLWDIVESILGSSPVSCQRKPSFTDRDRGGIFFRQPVAASKAMHAGDLDFRGGD